MLMNSNYLTSAMNILRSKVARMSMFLASVMSLLLISACSSGGNEVEIYQSDRSNIVDVKPLIKAIDTDGLLLSDAIAPYSLDDYFAIKDHKSPGNMIYIFDGSSYKLLASTGRSGQGPGEIMGATMGDLIWDGERRELYVPDFSNYKVNGFSIDSVLANSDYLPYEKSRLNDGMLPSDIVYVNDTLSYCGIIKPTSFNSFDKVTGKWNMLTGDVEVLPYKYPDLYKYRYFVTASVEANTIVEANMLYDLVSILDLDGNLKHNVHGPNWATRGDGNQHFTGVRMYGRFILASYDGTVYEDNNRATKIIVFDTDGNYVKTLDVGWGITDFCVDKMRHRLILSLDDDIQLGYLDLDEVLD